MSRRVSSLDKSTAGIERDIKSQYDNVKAVADRIEDVRRLSLSADNIDIVQEHVENIDAVSTAVEGINRYLESADILETLASSIDNLNRLYTSILNLDRIHASIDGLDEIAADIDVIVQANTNIANIDIVVANLDDVLTVSNNVDSVVVAADNIDNINSAPANAVTASTAATEAASSAAAADAIFDEFNSRYLGSYLTPPVVQNDGNPLVEGAIYFNNSDKVIYIFDGTVWVVGYSTDALRKSASLSDLPDVAAARTNLGLGTAAVTDSSAYATSAQGTLADSAIQPSDNVSQLTNDADYATTSYVNSAEAAANSYTDARELAVTQAYKAYADTAEADANTYTDNAIAGLVDTAPATLDTLNELAAALGDDPNFATTVSNSIGTKWTQDNTKIANWDSAFGWGNHADEGYLTVETDPIYSASSWFSTTNNSSNWDTAFGWGDHSVENYIVDGTDATLSSLQLTGGSGTQGTFSWNVDEETADLIVGGATLQLGQETHIHVRNNTAVTIPNGTAVMATGTLGASGRITVAPMIANGSVLPSYFLGVTTEDIAAGVDGKITTFGKIRNLNTSVWSNGDVLWLNPVVAGGFTNVQPQSPNLKIAAAYVVYSGVNGTLFVRANGGIDLHNNHRVQILSPDANGNPTVEDSVLLWSNTNTRWENHTPAETVTALGLDTVVKQGDNVSDLTNDAGYATTNYVDTELADKADQATTYTKTEVDAAIAANPGVTSLLSLTDVTGDGTSGQVLTTDGSGSFSFTTVESGGGSSTVNMPITGLATEVFPHVNDDTTLPSGVDTLDTYIISKNDGNWTGYKPPGANNAIGAISLHTHLGNYFTQLLLSTATNELFIRSANNTTSFGTAVKLLSTANIGAEIVPNLIDSAGYNTNISNGYANEGSRNTVIGFQAANNMTSGVDNTIVGQRASYTKSASNYSTVIGSTAAYNSSAGDYLTIIGYNAGKDVSASENTLIGANTGLKVSTGGTNTFTGYRNGELATTAHNNSIFGAWSGTKLSSGARNVFLGRSAGNGVTVGTDNIAIGYNAYNGGTSGNNNIAIGQNSGPLTANAGFVGSNNTYIGYGAAPLADTDSGVMVLGGSTLTKISSPIGLSVTSAVTALPGALQLQVLSSAPSSPTAGMIAIADGSGWNPTGSGVQQCVAYLNGAWASLA